MGEHARRGLTSGRWADLGRRVASALVLAPVALACVWFGGPAYDTLIVLGGAGLAVEWATLCGSTPARLPGLWVAMLVMAAAALAIIEPAALGVGLLFVGGAALWGFSRQGLLAAGVPYIGLPVVALLWLRVQPGGRDVLLFLLLVIWASDIGAYLVGRTLRGPKLAPMLSPGKTVSGALGGLAAVLLVALAMPPHRWALALLLGVVCQAGDLLESGIKRHVGVKDSGRWIPGHGGLLDRLDSLLTAAPVAAAVMWWSRGGLG